VRYPVTPDGRYFVVRGRLWRTTNPALPEAERAKWVKVLSAGRAALRKSADPSPAARAAARKQVDRAKRALGERGPVWWADGSPDYNRHLAKNTPYRGWFEGL
jgi:hypothetical protein